MGDMLQFSKEQLHILSKLLPSPSCGRPRSDRGKAIGEIPWILDYGAKWKDLTAEFGSKSLVRRVCHHFGCECAHASNCSPILDRWLASATASRPNDFVLAERSPKQRVGGGGIRCAKTGKGVKILTMADSGGLPIASDTGSSSPHGSHLAEPPFDFIIAGDFPKKLICDKARNSDKLDQTMTGTGAEMISPHRANQKQESKAHDGRKPCGYQRRWPVELTIRRLQNYRPLCVCWEESTSMFQGFVNLTHPLLPMKQVWG